MREIEIVFTKSRKKLPIGSWLFRWWTGREYSHVARRLWVPGFDHPSYFQANEGKVNYEYAPHFLREHTIVKEYKIEVTNEAYAKISRACWESKGENYGSKQNIGIALCNIAKKLGFNNCRNPWKKGKNCSELIYVNIMKPMFPDLDYDPNTIRPHDIENIILERCINTKE
jgi:hypothetical protein